MCVGTSIDDVERLTVLQGLSSLAANGNPLRGSLPSSISALTALTSLHMDSCQLSGSLPAELVLLTSLQYA